MKALEEKLYMLMLGCVTYNAMIIIRETRLFIYNNTPMQVHARQVII